MIEKTKHVRLVLKVFIFFISVLTASSAYSNSMPLVESLKTKLQHIDTSVIESALQSTLFKTKAKLRTGLEHTLTKLKNIEYKDVEASLKNIIHEVENADDVLGLHDSGLFEAMGLVS